MRDQRNIGLKKSKDCPDFLRLFESLRIIFPVGLKVQISFSLWWANNEILNSSNKVLELILITVHKIAPKSSDQRYILDIDLSIFALPWELFKQNSEYSHLSDEEFNRNHLSFLHGLLKRPQFFQQNYGNTARENITKCIKSNLLTVFKPLN